LPSISFPPPPIIKLIFSFISLFSIILLKTGGENDRFWRSPENRSLHPDFILGIIGVPFDEKSSFIRGAAGGPAAIRRVSTGKTYNPDTELEVDLAEETVLVDLGDVDTSGDVDKTFSGIETAVSEVVQRGAIPIILGGDHSITYPSVKGMASRFEHLDLLHLDAHPDLYDELYGDRLSHACPLARILKMGWWSSWFRLVRGRLPPSRGSWLKGMGSEQLKPGI